MSSESLLENVAENFGATFQDNYFQVNELGQEDENKRIAAMQNARQETNCAAGNCTKKRLAQATSVSKTSARRTTKLLQL